VTNVPVVVAVVSTELLVLLQVTSKAFRSESYVETAHGDAVRKARAGLEAAKLIPRLAALFEQAERVHRRRSSERDSGPFDTDEIEERRSRIRDLLSWGGDIAPKVTAAAIAGAESREPDLAKKRLEQCWGHLCWPLVVTQVLCPLFLLDSMLGRQVGPQFLDTGAAIAFAIGATCSLLLIVRIGLADRALGRAITKGKDARDDDV
jgi:hypothetical protein